MDFSPVCRLFNLMISLAKLEIIIFEKLRGMPSVGILIWPRNFHEGKNAKDLIKSNREKTKFFRYLFIFIQKFHSI